MGALDEVDRGLCVDEHLLLAGSVAPPSAGPAVSAHVEQVRGDAVPRGELRTEVEVAGTGVSAGTVVEDERRDRIGRDVGKVGELDAVGGREVSGRVGLACRS